LGVGCCAAGIQAVLLDRAQRVRGHAQRDPPLLAFEPETLRVQVRQEATALLVVGVGHGVAHDGALASEFADAGHLGSP